MKPLATILIEKLHTGGHAFLLFGSRTEVAPLIHEYIKKTYNLEKGNADFIEYTSDSFGIDDVRTLTARVYQKNISEVSTVILNVRTITPEAQNALLKTLEEPQTKTIFFILMPPGAYVLDTVRSRVSVIVLESDRSTHKFVYKTFAEKTFPDRVSYIEKLSKDKETDSYNREIIAAIVGSILEELHQEGHYKVSKDIQDITEYIYDQSASIKYIIEYISLAVPHLSS